MYPLAPEEGIYILPSDAKVGADAVELLGLHDTVFEYEITNNRVDCYSILGLAREVSATFDKPLVKPSEESKDNGEDVHDFLEVEVVDSDLCPRYTARMVKNIKIGPSPEWMQRRLAACGIRPINNLVDITNYVMEEYGQPMHAFDYDTISGHKIVVRRAKDGDVFQTLDEQMRNLDKDVLMICDAEKEIGIAGIMGGENSKITDNIKTVVFEGACFDGTNIRLSSKRLGMRTDASGKYEKGLDPENAEAAINRACALVEELGCGEVVGGIIDVYPNKREKVVLPFTPEKYNDLLGIEVPEADMIEMFKKLELEYDAEKREIIIPTFRQDLKCGADIAEEVARIYGYDKIPNTLPFGEVTAGKVSFKHRIESLAADVAEYNGFSQGMTYSFESPKVFDKLLIPEDSPLRNVVTITNPLGEDYSIMRTTALNGMLTSLATNYNRRNKSVKLYELGTVYLPKALPLTELPDERMQFILGFYGAGDFFDMKGVVEEFFEKLGMNERVTYDAKAGKPFLHPGRQANIIYKGQVIGWLGEVHPQVADNYDIGERVYLANLDMPYVTEFATFDRKYEGIAKYPALTRDISMVVKKELTVGEIEAVILKKGGKLLESCALFDVYEGSQIEEGFKSVAYNIVFRAKDHTLADTEVNEIMEKILKGLNALGIELRG
jgi:phenylalanyl-tRNA synthetase beta chain